LAIKTIVEDQKFVDVLWPPLLWNQSNVEVASEEKIIAMNGLSFGLIIENRANHTKAQFLHRTYAEYLFARYLYKGFLLDDDQHNKLLENESIQKLILNKILSIEQYDGVQVFFNGMLKELVDDDQEWRNRIILRDLPERFTKFAKHLFTQFLRKYPSSLFRFQKVTEERSRMFPNALCYSISTGKEKIFKFFCDFLEATFDKKLIQNAMMNSFMTNKSYFSFKFFRHTESELFERFIGYLYSDDSKDPASNADTKFNWHEKLLPPCDLEYSQWNEKEQQNMVRTLLEFIVKQRTTFDKHFSNMYLIVPMLTFLIFNENYDSHLEIYLERLSRSANYSDNSNFASLLKMILQESKRHFVRGRIGKMLIILNELERRNLLTRLYGTILVTEPEAFHSIYKPIEEEGEIPADLHFLFERDSYRMTRLHREAFHGNTEAVEEMLERIRQNLTDPEQKEVADKIINEIIARDEYGFTPFYVAAACGHKEIYHKMLAFLKQVLHEDTLEEHLIDEGGFVHRALSDSIDSENIQMFQLILKAVKKELGQKELIRVLNPELHFHSRMQKSLKPTFFNRCKTKEFFNAMAKIVVTRHDNVADYTDLYDLISHKYYPDTKRSLEDIDNENLQGLLLLKGVEDFTKSVLDIQSLSCGFKLLSRNLLKHFTKDQLEQFVQTITSKHYTKKNRSIWVIPVDSAHVDDKKTKDHILYCLNLGGWTKDDLVFEDEGNGATTIYAERIVPRPSYWKDYIEEHLLRNTSYPDSIYMKLTSMNDGFPFREYIDCICECFKHLGDNSAKELLLHEETQGYIMIRFPQNMVKLMLNCLTQESQEEVKQKWKNNAPPMKRFFPLTSQILSEEHCSARICSAILHFYLEYGSNDHLKEFAKVVTVLHNIGQVQHSLWSYVFEKVDLRETNEILKIVSEKMEFLGKDGVKQLLLHEIDNVPFIIKAVSWGEDVDLWLEILPEDLREEIQQFIQQNAPDFIEKAFCNPTAYFKTFSWGHYHKRLNAFTFFLSFSNEHQLQSFVPKITSKRVGGQQGVHERSMWGEIFTHEWESNDEYGKKKTEDFAKMNKFMTIMSEKLGSNAVKELLLHQDGELLVVFYLALRGEEEMLETLLNYLPAKDRKKVQRKVDKFLDETYKIPQDDED
jgi:rRNA maturation protein Rpf1